MNSTLKKRAFSSLELQVLKLSKEFKIENSKILLGVSGGMDSMVLAHVFNRLKKPLNLELLVCHVFHGHTNDAVQFEYRLKAWELVQKFSLLNNIQFISNLKDHEPNSTNQVNLNPPIETALKSESDFRKYRIKCFNEWKNVYNSDDKHLRLAFAHHHQDVLETHLIRLIRGTGVTGFAGMKVYNGSIFRPFLSISKSSLEKYTNNFNIDYIHDPSNDSNKFLRNWIRNKWLKDLEDYRPGSVGTLAKSFSLIQNQINQLEKVSEQPQVDAQYIELGRVEFSKLNINQKSLELVKSFQKLNLKNYSQKHIFEVIKRLDTQRKRFTFTLLGMTWAIQKEKILIFQSEGESV